jgi:hypothetical protein
MVVAASLTYGHAGAVEPTAPATDATMEPAAGPDAQTSAIWVERTIEFSYIGHTTFYSCDGLRNKVRYVLEQIGVHPGYSVIIRACYAPTGPVEWPRVRIKAALPREVTPELLAELERSAAKRELVARVRGETTVINNPEAGFPASWQELRIESGRLTRIQDGDCELMAQLVPQVLEPLGVRVAEESRTDCVMGQVIMNSIRLKLEVLRPVAERAPAEATEQPQSGSVAPDRETT